MIEFIDLHTGQSTGRCDVCVICLGNFDGVHKGHAALMKKTGELKRELGGRYEGIVGGAWCFKQPPADFLSDDPPKHLTTLDEKLSYFAENGLDVAVLGDFSELRNTDKTAFVNDVLKKRCGAVCAVCGFNFRFGKDGAGTPSDLLTLPEGAVIEDPVKYGGEIISSSLIRKYLVEGETEKAVAMLGHGYLIDAEVTHGKELGRVLGFPTINQEFGKNKLIVKEGVYVSETSVDGKEYRSVTNVGGNPTFPGDDLRAETHIIGYSGNLYGKKIKVNLLSYIRGEIRFDGADALKRALEGDVETAKKY